MRLIGQIFSCFFAQRYVSALYFLRSTRSYPFYPFSPPLPALPFNLSVFYFFFPVHLTRRQGGRRGEEEYFTRLILRGTGAITVAINDNVKTFYRDFSTLSRLTAQGKYREPRFEPHYLGVREFRTDIDTGEARRGEEISSTEEWICAVCVLKRVYMRYFDRSRCRTIFRDLEGGGTAIPSKCANDNVSANDDKEVVSWWMSVTFNSIRIRACRFHFFSFFFDNISRKMEVSSLISRARTNGKFLFKNNLAGRS